MRLLGLILYIFQIPLFLSGTIQRVCDATSVTSHKSQSIHCVTRTRHPPSRVTLVSHSLSCKATTMLITSHHHKKSTNLCHNNIPKNGTNVSMSHLFPSIGTCALLTLSLKYSAKIQPRAVSGSEGVQRFESIGNIGGDFSVRRG